MNRQIFILQNPSKNIMVQNDPIAMIRGSWNRSIQNKILILKIQQERQNQIQIQNPQNSPIQQSIQSHISPFLYLY